MKKQTAVEWLVEQFEESYSYINEIFKETIEQAKAMEREQMVHCYEQAYRDGYIDNGKSGEQYYNETYGGDK
jgi:hypothetical protein